MMEIINLIHFFELHQDFDRDIHMLLTEGSDWELPHGMFLSHTNLRVHIYCSDHEIRKSVAKIPGWNENYGENNQIQFHDVNEIFNAEKIGTLVFGERTDFRTIQKLAEKQPKALVGLMHGTNVSYMRIWEAYKPFCKHIYLCYRLTNGKCEVFDWEPKNECELSVIFPVYNVGKYLEKCIESVTAWKAPYVEYLFVNDGSKDNSRDIILQYAKKDPRIRLIDKPNGGCASARQKGLEQARGRYIGFVDPDDFVDPDMFRQLLGRAMLGNYETCYCGYNEYYESNGESKPIKSDLVEPYLWGTNDKNAVNKLIMYQRVAIWRGIYRRDLIERCGISFQTNLRRFDDLPFKVEICAYARSAVVIPMCLYYYRLGRPGQDVSCADDRLFVHFDIFKHLDAVMDKIDDRRLKDYLQICKVQTHDYALSKIERKYGKAYIKMAQEDFRRNAGILHTLICIKRWVDMRTAKSYLKTMLGIDLFSREMARDN